MLKLCTVQELVLCCTVLYCTAQEKGLIAREALYDTTWASFSVSTFLNLTENTIP